MMKKQLVRTAAALLFFCAAGGAQAFTVPGPTNPAVEVTLSGWAFGSAHQVQASATTATGAIDYRGLAGAYTGSLNGAGDMDSAAFIALCIEIEEHLAFGTTIGYSLVGGSEYFGRRRGDAGIADRLGRLMTYAADNTGLVGSTGGSTALQLAVWNLVYDNDWSVTSRGLFNDGSAHGSAASALLAGAQGVENSRYDVFALENGGRQDLLAIAPRAPDATVSRVSEPGSLGLAGSALLGLLLARRRRT